MLTSTPTVIIADRNEVKFLLATGLNGKEAPRDQNVLDFEFDATEDFFEARRGYSLNYPCPILSFIAASRFVDKAIYDHRQRQGVEI